MSQQVLLLVSILVALYSSGKLSYVSAPLFLFGRLQDFYLPQSLSALGRFISYIALRLAGALNAWTAALLSALNITVNAFLLSKKSAKFMEWPHKSDPVKEREILNFILPSSPAIVFAAFQGQLSLFLISIFGQTTNIAEVAALSKIAQLFIVFTVFNSIVVEPYIARLPKERLRRVYFKLLALATVLSVPVVLLAFFAPTPILWVLGPRYQNLGNLIGWVVLSSCINYVASLMWIMNRARKWILWKGSILEIVLLIVTQTIFMGVLGMHSTKDAVMLSFAASFCYVIAHGYVTLHGFLRLQRDISVAV